MNAAEGEIAVWRMQAEENQQTLAEKGKEYAGVTAELDSVTAEFDAVKLELGTLQQELEDVTHPDSPLRLC